MFARKTQDDEKVTNAEILYTMHLVEHNVSIKSSECCGKLFRKIFTDIKIAQQYRCSRTKTTRLINDCLSTSFITALVCKMQNQPYTISVDGSNDKDLKKLNPLTVRIFDANRVNTTFLDMCVTESSTADAIFCSIDGVFERYSIPWDKCIALSVDSAAVNTGVRNSIATRVLKKNSNVYIAKCPCHMAHNNAFRLLTGFDIEDMLVDVYYWFKYSSVRKHCLNDFCSLYDVEFKKVMKRICSVTQLRVLH